MAARMESEFRADRAEAERVEVQTAQGERSGMQYNESDRSEQRGSRRRGEHGGRSDHRTCRIFGRQRAMKSDGLTPRWPTRMRRHPAP